MDNENVEHHEEIHLPAPSAAPIIVAAGMTLALVGLLETGLLFLGLALLATGIGMWAFGKG
jgi:hypothetical protein